VSRSLQVKHLLCRFRKRVGALFLLQNTIFFAPIQLSIFFSGIKCCWTGSPIHPLFLCSFYILCCTCSLPENSWNSAHWTINQSRCDSILFNDTSSFFNLWRWQGDTGKPEIGKRTAKGKQWQEDDTNEWWAKINNLIFKNHNSVSDSK
jgi:hypothetical protein